MAAFGEALEARQLFAAITRLSLIDPSLDRAVPGFDALVDGAVINVRDLPDGKLNIAAIADATTDQVRFELDGRAARVERAAPFALFGDDRGDFAGGTLSLGQHTLTATPYLPMVGRTPLPVRAGEPATIRFTLVDRPTIALTLYDADADVPIAGYAELRSGTTIDLASLPSRNLTIRATGVVPATGRVEFAFDQLPTRAEFSAPYSLFGDDGDGDLFAGPLSVGTHTLVVRAASASDATTFDAEGRASFTVVDSASTGPTFVPANLWTTTFNAAGTLPAFAVAGGEIVPSADTTSVRINGRALEASEYILAGDSVRLLAPLVDGENRVELDARAAGTGASVAATFTFWAGSADLSVTASAAIGEVNIVASVPGMGVAVEGVVPSGGIGIVASTPRVPLDLDGSDVSGTTTYAGRSDGRGGVAFIEPNAGHDPRAPAQPGEVPSPPSPGTSPTTPNTPTSPTPTPTTDPLAPKADGSLRIFAELGSPESPLPGITPYVCDGGASWAFGRYIEGGEWHVGGWWGPHEEVDPAALQRYLAALPVGTVYLSNSFEDQLGTKLSQVATVLRAASERGLIVGWFGLPTFRFTGDLATYQANNDYYTNALRPYLDMLTPAYYFGDDAPMMSDEMIAWYAESMDEAVRLADGLPIVPTISPYTHGGTPVPVEKTLQLVSLLRQRGVANVMIWTDQGLTPHVQATIDALAAA